MFPSMEGEYPSASAFVSYATQAKSIAETIRSAAAQSSQRNAASPNQGLASPFQRPGIQPSQSNSPNMAIVAPMPAYGQSSANHPQGNMSQKQDMWKSTQSSVQDIHRSFQENTTPESGGFSQQALPMTFVSPPAAPTTNLPSGYANPQSGGVSMNDQHCGSQNTSEGRLAATDTDPTPKRSRGSYRCRRCGQPKKGHVCTGNSPLPGGIALLSPGVGSFAGSLQGTPLSISHGSMGTPGSITQRILGAITPILTPPHPGMAGAAHTFPQQSYVSPGQMLPGAGSEGQINPRPSAAALGIQPMRLPGMGLSPELGSTMPAPGPQGPHAGQPNSGYSSLTSLQGEYHTQGEQGMSSFTTAAPSFTSLETQPHIAPEQQFTEGGAAQAQLHPPSMQQHPSSNMTQIQHQSSQAELQHSSVHASQLQTDGSQMRNPGADTDGGRYAGTTSLAMGHASSDVPGNLQQNPSPVPRPGLQAGHEAPPSVFSSAQGLVESPAQGPRTGQAAVQEASKNVLPSSFSTPVSGARVMAVLKNALSMSSALPFDAFAQPPTAVPSAGVEAGDDDMEGAQSEQAMPEAPKRSEQDLCMLNILAKLCPSDLMAASQCCRRWYKLAREVWWSVESAVLVLDESRAPHEFVPFVLRRTPQLQHLTLLTKRVVDDHLLQRIAAERPTLVSLIIRPDPDVACQVTEFGLSAFVRGCRLLEKVEIGNSVCIGGVHLQSYSLRALSLLSATSLASRFSLSCPSLLELSLSFFASGARVLTSPPGAVAISSNALKCASPTPPPPPQVPAGSSAALEEFKSPGDLSTKPSVSNAGDGHALTPSGSQPQGTPESHQVQTQGTLEVLNAQTTASAGVPSEATAGDEGAAGGQEAEGTTAGAAGCGEPHHKPAKGLVHQAQAPLHASRRRVEAVLGQVAKLTNPLKRLHVACLHTSDAMLSPILSTHGPSLRALSLTNSQVLTDEGVRHIVAGCKHLEFLDLSGCSLLTDNGLAHIRNNAQSLSKLLVSCCPKLSARGIMSTVASLPNLTLLDVGHTLVSPTQFADSEVGSKTDSRDGTPAADQDGAPVGTPARGFGVMRDGNKETPGKVLGESQGKKGPSATLTPRATTLQESTDKENDARLDGSADDSPATKRKRENGAQPAAMCRTVDDAVCRLKLVSPSLKQLSLWGCGALSRLELECPNLLDLNLKQCGRITASNEELRGMCPNLHHLFT